MDSSSKPSPSSHYPERDPGESIPSPRNRREIIGSERLAIAPVLPEELPEEMRSVLESVCAGPCPSHLSYGILIIYAGQFISSQRPSLADTRLARPDVQRTGTSGPDQSQGSSTQGHERYDYDGRNDNTLRVPNSKWPFTFSLKGGKFPSRVYHTRKVVPRSRPNAKEQLGKRKWHPSRRHGMVIRREDYDAYEAHELGQTPQFLNSESLLDLSVRDGRLRGEEGEGSGGSTLWRWPRGGKNKLGKATRKLLCRG